jgi:hypothetical protein
VPVQAVERLGRVLARDGAVNQDRPPAGMQLGKAGEVVDLCVYDDPL